MLIGDQHSNRKNPHRISQFFQIYLINSAKNFRLIPNAMQRRGREPSERISRIATKIPGFEPPEEVASMKPIHIQIYEIGSAKNCRLAPNAM
jgi:hypothetical protein